ncbi:glycosyltransferase [Pedobacter sp. LMG 31464]|uniref:Glycosyltransferase n=1 Tax=Pedobacter planticolens TaxID=2679964 RepID=A0A923E1L3_9SPHI|nr:glycosyltransferase [Pedobacter planticolens]MBB2145899.1 glycosyltransferase [Pedobacter planticolens]
MSGISVIITYYKGENYIFNCIGTLVRSFELSKKKLQLQVIVVIDSMEDADYIVLEFKKRYLDLNLLIIRNAENIGVSKSRNIGLENIKYNFYTIMDQDDYVRDAYFSVLENELSDHTAVHLINGAIRYADQQIEIPIYHFAPSFSFKSLIFQSTFIFTPGLVIFNKDLVPPKNLFLETSNQYKGCDDLAAYLNILKGEVEVRVKYIPADLFVYCLHNNNYSNNVEEMLFSYKSVIDHFENDPQLSRQHRKLIDKVNVRYHFLYARKKLKVGIAKLIFGYPYQFFNHYLFSLKEKNRINRLIYWTRYKLKQKGKI